MKFEVTACVRGKSFESTAVHCVEIPFMPTMGMSICLSTEHGWESEVVSAVWEPETGMGRVTLMDIPLQGYSWENPEWLEEEFEKLGFHSGCCNPCQSAWASE